MCLKFAEEHLDVPQHHWLNILWTDEMTLDLENKKKGSAQTPILHLNMVAGASWLGSALLPQGLDGLLSLMEKQV